jgi:glutamate formiminotransferase / 5-formyltetrahydrofolate cyclo-ligase
MPPLFEAVPNFSAGIDPDLLRALRGTGALDQHADPVHNRCVVTLVETDGSRLQGALMERVEVARARIDLRSHRGLHPRLGAVDVLPVVPLPGATLEAAGAIARRLAEEMWDGDRIPTWFYGDLAGGRTLADLRRAAVPPPFDVGDTSHPTAGACCVGARPPLVAFNFVLHRPRREVSAVLPRLRALPGVRALTFPLPGERVQLSTNLTRPDQVGVATLARTVAELLGEPGEPELVGLCPAAAAGPGCDGGLLEARLIAHAARRLGARCRDAGGAERREMGDRLERRAVEVAATAATAEGMLAAAEEAVSFLRLRAALGVEDEVSVACLRAGAGGLRQALECGPRPALRERMVLLDRWLAAV